MIVHAAFYFSSVNGIKDDNNLFLLWYGELMMINFLVYILVNTLLLGYSPW